MNRPMYESKADLRREEAVISEFCKIYNLDKKKLPYTQKIDFALYKRDRIYAFVEVKCRVFNKDKYETMFINLDKVQAARNLSHLTGHRVLLLVCWADVMGHIDFTEPFETKLGGRTDRNDVLDFGIVAHYPIDKFRVIGTSPIIGGK